MTTNNQFKSPHELADKIFTEILPAKGMAVRENQIKLCHTMLDAMMHHDIALCDAGTGIGKTYSYLVAGLIKSRYEPVKSPVLISTSSIALQNSIINEYIPFLSKALLAAGIIDKPLKAVVRKGKNRYVCDRRLAQRLISVSRANKNRQQRDALLSLNMNIDLDAVQNLSEYDKAAVRVKSCVGCDYQACRYHDFIKRSHSPAFDYQICNHNLLIADALHRNEGFNSILPYHCTLVIDEAHKLPETIRSMFCTEFDIRDIKRVVDDLRGEGFFLARGKLLSAFAGLRSGMSELRFLPDMGAVRYPKTEAHQRQLNEMREEAEKIYRVLKREVSPDLSNQLKRLKNKLSVLADADDTCVRFAECDDDGIIKLCAVPLNAESNLRKLIWSTCSSAVLTSGTLSVGSDFSRFKDAVGLGGMNSRISESVYPSPFDYEHNCLLYLPKTQQYTRMAETDEYYDATAWKIADLINATHGHTLVLFTSYTAMSEIYARLQKARLSSEIFLMRRLSDGAMERFKASGNGVLLGTGSIWEGMDFPGDLVSSLIIPRLPFAVPDAMSEAKRNSFLCLKDFLDRTVVPDMQIKLRQGFGRAIRTESDSCVISILDERAAPGQRYYDAVRVALPEMPMTAELADVSGFIWNHKSDEYFVEKI